MPSMDAAPHELTTADVDAWLDGFLPAALKREGIAGAVVSVVGGGSAVTERGFGWADTGVSGNDPIPVDAQRTLFRIGSISKLVTATAVMQLVEDGRLDLDAPVQQYLDFTLPVAFEQPVTVRHLLTHTAGFEDKIAGLFRGPDTELPTLYDAVTVDPPEQIFAPGTMPAYSNYANGLAAYLVQHITGEPYEDVVEREVFAPAGMVNATLQQPLLEPALSNMSKGYDSARSPEVPFEVVSPAPAGAISATAADMSAFMIAQLDGSLLDAATREQMQAPGLDSADIGGLAAGPQMTLGFFEQDRNGHRIIGHGGDLTAFHSQLDLYPEDAAGIFVSLNSSGLTSDSTTAIRNALSEGFADRYFPGKQAAAATSVTAGDHSGALIGTYQLSRRGESTFIRLYFTLSSITVAQGPGDSITISAITDASGSPVPLVEVEPWVWQEAGGQTRVAVDQRDGVVTAIGLGPAFTLQPMPATRAILPLVFGATLLILLATAVLTPVAALVRRWHGTSVPRTRYQARLRILIASSLVALLAAGALWGVAASALLSNAEPPPDAVFRTAQALSAAAVLGAVPALLLTVTHLRPQPGTGREQGVRLILRVSVSALITLAFCGLGYAVIVAGLLSRSITY
ncbi:beta-lactamase family protein [Arthrobacter sp. Sa2BUA2]|uniref:Beta-lactamase family protein n=1 Tax=Arthrobacter pullicola TaxID=2762224 RepID=A0ABR8YIX2_9MICC|nr:beta-lactamase family protein [Arthrobacter pullicola]